MKNWSWKTIAIGIFSVFIFFWFIKAPIMSSYLSNALGIKIFVGQIAIRPTMMKISNFRISNPINYQSTTAFKAKSIRAYYEWKQLRGDSSVIDRVEIDQIYLGIEFFSSLGTKNNWSDLLSKMPQKDENSKEVIIRKLVLTNMTVDIRKMGVFSKSQTQTIDRMEFENISSKKGFPTEELVSQIFKNAGLMQYIQNIIPTNPADIIKKIIPFGAIREPSNDCLALENDKKPDKTTD
jgi:hypothetical protein